MPTLLLLIFLVLLVLWIYALVDLVRAVEMELGARLIIALLLVMVAPLGIVAWLVVRAPRMGRVAAATVAVLIVLVVAGVITEFVFPARSSVVSTSVGGSSGPVGSGISRTTYRLYTHCGIHRIDNQGRTYLADPALDDGNANPPPGWGNPVDEGTLTLTPGFADFTDARGNHAHFHEVIGASPAPRCM